MLVSGDGHNALVHVDYTDKPVKRGDSAIFRLTIENGAWKIADIQDNLGQWLLDGLEKSNQKFIQEKHLKY